MAEGRELLTDSEWTVSILYLWYTDQYTINFFKANKGVWRMPRVYEAMKDVVSCDKLRRAAHKRYIRRFPNGTT
jgi:hypothetical protein